MQRAKRLSAHLSAGVSAAGRAAYRLRNALVTRASAIQQLLVVDEAEQETSQVGHSGLVAIMWCVSLGRQGKDSTKQQLQVCSRAP
jgi:hypothetical protein